MNIYDAIEVVEDLSPVFDMTGIGNNRVIEDEELAKLAKACEVIRNKLVNKTNCWDVTDLLARSYGSSEIINNMVVIGFGMKAESAKRMLDRRRYLKLILPIANNTV